MEDEKTAPLFYSLAIFVTQMTTWRMNVDYLLKTLRLPSIPDCLVNNLSRYHLSCARETRKSSPHSVEFEVLVISS